MCEHERAGYGPLAGLRRPIEDNVSDGSARMVFSSFMRSLLLLLGVRPEPLDSAHRFRHPRNRIGAMPHHEHGLQGIRLADLVLRQQVASNQRVLGMPGVSMKVLSTKRERTQS